MTVSLRLALVSLVAPVLSPVAASARLDFNRDVRPILSENCFYCHGQDGNHRKKDLRLDQREAAVKAGAIVDGDPAKSKLLARVFSTDADELMPPPDSHRTLSPAQRETLKQWVAEGAEYKSHWAYIPPVKAERPKSRFSDRSRGAVDDFIFAKLAAEGLEPSPEADKVTLIRRVTLDLTGLPPTPEEVDAFVADTAPDAYEKVVDRLLASPHYGERMCLPWLDAARYADSNGFQQDGDTHQWVWRDWVVRALNADMGFDQFSIEQLAGDLLPEAKPEQLVASAFNRNHLLNGEGGAIAEEQRNVILFDRVDTTSTTWLGLTMACAQCHDHKYDPMTQRDYYSLMACFNNVPESGVPGGSGQYRIADPWIHYGTPEEMAKLKEMELAAGNAAAAEKKMSEAPETAAAQTAWEQAMKAGAAVPWQPQRPAEAKAGAGGERVVLTVQEDDSLLATGLRPDKTDYIVTLPPAPAGLTGLRIETIPDKRLPSKGAGRSDSGNAVLTRLLLTIGGKKVAFSAASADYTQGTFSPGGVIDDNPDTAWAFYPDTAVPHSLVVQLAEPLSAPAPAEPMVLTFEFQSPHKQHQLGRFRISTTTAPQPSDRVNLPAEVTAALAKEPAARSKEEAEKVRTQFLATGAPAPVAAARKKKQQADKALTDFKNQVPRVMVMSDAKPRKTNILDRGNYLAPKDEVTAATPAFLPAPPADAPRNRLGFARWLFQPGHPLTARVQVNRFWQTFFGTGLVKTSEDLGVQSSMPVHLELLDWLAVDFREQGWSMKKVVRSLVTSATYRQQSRVTPALAQKDPENTLFARSSRFRLSSLLLRDVALAASGLLDSRMGGKPVYPYQPDAIWENLAITKERDFTYPASSGADLYRRSLYTFWRRTIGPANMFDVSVRQSCKVRPGQTCTPLHALTTLNDVTWSEAARVLAARAMKAAPDRPAQFTHAFRRVLSRSPKPQELDLLERMYARQLAIFTADAKAAEAVVTSGAAPKADLPDVPAHAAFSCVCLALLNLDEALNHE